MSKEKRALRELEVLALDCQATHADPDKGRVLEIGWVKTRASDGFDFEKITKDAEVFLLKAPRVAKIPRSVFRIMGISQEELKSARAPGEVWQRLSRIAEDMAAEISKDDTQQKRGNIPVQTLVEDYHVACPAVVHFCRYEEPLLRQLHKKHSPQKDFPLSIVCTHEIVKRLLPGLPRKSLRAVAGYFGQSLPENRRCLHHVAATALLWSRLVELLEDTHAITTYDKLLAWLRQSMAHPSNHRRARRYPMPEGYHKNLPHQPGIYRMYRSGGDLLYIGKAKNLRERVGSYFHKGSRHAEHILEMLSQARSLDTTITRNAFEAALVESDEIKKHSPPYNRALKTNERNVQFFSRDLKSANSQPDSRHSIGPLPSSHYLNSLVVLGDRLNGDLRRISLKDIEDVLDLPPDYLPGRACFVSGVKTFKQDFYKPSQPAFDLTKWMSLGTQFWKEKLKEQAAEEAEKREAAEASIEKREALKPETQREALEGDDAPVPETEELFELKMQGAESQETGDTWSPERVVKVLKSIIRKGAFEIRRSRWLCRLSESSIIWSSLAGASEAWNLIMFNGGAPIFKDPLYSSETVPLPAGHKKPLFERQKNFDLFVYDRMRLATAEVRRLIREERKVEIWLHPDVCLRNEQLKRILQWV